jgi:hypothetical protein
MKVTVQVTIHDEEAGEVERCRTVVIDEGESAEEVAQSVALTAALGILEEIECLREKLGLPQGEREER